MMQKHTVRSRIDHQREVERLLEQIRGGVTELRRLQAAGVRRAAVADRKLELKETRGRLAALIGSAEPAHDRAA